MQISPGVLRVFVWILVCVAPVKLLAHDARPVAVTLMETLPGVYGVEIRVPPTVSVDNHPLLRLPSGCEWTGAAALHCAAGLGGQTLVLDFPRYNPALATFFRIGTLDGTETSAILPPADSAWTVPEAMTRKQVAQGYLLLGVEHIIGGLDHLLFVLGLLVIARTPRRILITVTGFTLAHSITLSLSTLGMVALPMAPVEATIALSILFLAHEIARGEENSLTWRYPVLVSFGFGLLHGLGFASALGEIGLAGNAMFISLLFFNLGVELGQLLFIVAVVLVGAALRMASGARREAGNGLPQADLLTAYVIGVPSAFWVIERVAGFL